MQFRVGFKTPEKSFGVWALALFCVFSGCWLRPIGAPMPSPEKPVFKQDFQAKSRSKVEVGFPQLGKAVVFLYAAEEKEGEIEHPYCGGNRGAKTYEGRYELILAQESEVIDRLFLGELSFVEGYPFNGQLRVETVGLERGKTNFIILFQYRSCNMNEVWVFGYNGKEDRLVSLPFVRKEGSEVAVYVDPPQTKLLAATGDRFVSRYYDNGIGKFRVTEWVFNLEEQRFEEASYREE